MSKKIVEKIKEGMRRARKRGRVPGNPKLSEVRNTDLSAANRARIQKAQQFALYMLEILERLKREGIVGEDEAVNELNRRGITTRRGGQWSKTQYKQLWKNLNDMGVYGLERTRKVGEDR